MATVVAVNIKRKKGIKPSSQSKVSGVKWNWLSLMFCVDFLFESFALEFYFLKLEKLNLLQFGWR